MTGKGRLHLSVRSEPSFITFIICLFFILNSWSPIDYASREKHRDVVRILQDEGAVLAVLEQLEERRKQHEAAIAKLPEVKKKRNLFVDPEKEKEEAAADGEIEKESHSRENVINVCS